MTDSLVAASTPDRQQGPYGTGIITGALLWEDSKILAELLLSDHTHAQIRETVVSNNTLLRKSKKRSLNVASYLLQRLSSCPRPLLTMIAYADSISSRQASFVAALISSNFLRDFMNEVVCERLESFDHRLPPHFWNDFWASCRSKESTLHSLREKGVAEIRSTLLKFLAEIGILESVRARELHQISLSSQVAALINTPELAWTRAYIRCFVR